MPLHQKQQVVGLFPLDDRREVIVHLKSFDWDFASRNVLLVSGEDSLVARQVGSGNVDGHPALTLKPLGSWEELQRLVDRIKRRTNIFVSNGS